MNAIAGWLIMVGLMVLGSSIEKAAEKISSHQCEVKIKEKST